MLFPDLTVLIMKTLVIITQNYENKAYLCSRKNKHKIIKTMELPNDPMMLFSLINMKLRDFYPSLDSLCNDLSLNKDEIISRLKDAGFEYNEELNKFW